MTKRFLTLLLLTLLCLSFTWSLSLDASVDTASFQDLIAQWSENTYQISADLRSPVTENFE